MRRSGGRVDHSAAAVSPRDWYNLFSNYEDGSLVGHSDQVRNRGAKPSPTSPLPVAPGRLIMETNRINKRWWDSTGLVFSGTSLPFSLYPSPSIFLLLVALSLSLTPFLHIFWESRWVCEWEREREWTFAVKRVYKLRRWWWGNDDGATGNGEGLVFHYRT